MRALAFEAGGVVEGEAWTQVGRQKPTPPTELVSATPC